VQNLLERKGLIHTHLQKLTNLIYFSSCQASANSLLPFKKKQNHFNFENQEIPPPSDRESREENASVCSCTRETEIFDQVRD
jgi:hypothetical protein